MIEGLRDDQGKRFRRFFEKKEGAKTWLDKHSEKTKVEGRAGLLFTDAQRSDARRALVELETFPQATLSDAARFYADHLRRTTSSLPVADLIAQFLAAKESDGRAPRYLADLKSRLKDFQEAFGSVLVAAITTRDLDDWLRGLKLAPQTRVNHRRVLNAFFENAIARGYASENPVKRTEKPKVLHAEPGVISPAQLRSLLAAADSKLIPSLAIGAFAGLRPAEIRRLTWDAVDLEQRHINVSAQTSKTASRRLVPIADNLLDWLLSAPSRTGRVLPRNDRKLFDAARRGAKISEWPHDALRHSWVTYRYAASGDAARTAAEAGHDQTVLHKHYRALATKTVAGQWFAIKPSDAQDGPAQFPATAINS